MLSQQTMRQAIVAEDTLLTGKRLLLAALTIVMLQSELVLLAQCHYYIIAFSDGIFCVFVDP